MPRKPPRPVHSYLTETEIRQLDALVRRGARHLPPAECNRLLLLFQHHLGDLQQARRTNAGLRRQINSIRRDLPNPHPGETCPDSEPCPSHDALAP